MHVKKITYRTQGAAPYAAASTETPFVGHIKSKSPDTIKTRNGRHAGVKRT